MSMRHLTFTIPAGGAVKKEVDGDYLSVLELEAGFEVSINGGAWLPINRRMGLPLDYETIELRSDSAQKVILFVGKTNGKTPYDSQSQTLTVGAVDRINQKVKVITDAGDKLTVDQEVPGSISALPDKVVGATSAIKLADAKANRVELILSLPLNADDPVRVAGPNVAADRGARFFAGTSTVVNAQGEIWAFNEGADPVQVTLSEVLK